MLLYIKEGWNRKQQQICTGKLLKKKFKSFLFSKNRSEADMFEINTVFTRIRSLIFRKGMLYRLRNYSFVIYTLNENNTLLHTSIVGEAGFCRSLSSVWATSSAVDRYTLSAISWVCSLLTLKLVVILTQIHCYSEHGR